MIGRIAVLARSLWSNLVRRQRVEEALDDELRAYVDLVAAEYERAGMSPASARRTALVDTGGVERVKEAARDAWVGNALAQSSRELRYSLRSLRRSPTFLGVAVATLGIGMGGSTAVFTVIKGSLLRPLPGVAEPTRLVSVERVQSGRLIAEFSYPDYQDLRAHSTTLAGLAAYNGTSMALVDSSGTGRAWVSYVSDNFFRVLGVRPAVGRLFGPADTSASVEGAGAVVVLGYALWQQRFGGSPSAIGATLSLDGRAYTIIGVAPPGFIGAMATHPMELWIPIGVGDRPTPALDGRMDLASRRIGWFRLVARLAPGRRIEDAQRELAAIAGWLAATYPTTRDRGVRVLAGTGMTEEERVEARRLPGLLAMAVALLLLIACGNVASLTLVRAAARRRELATRLALGASRGALIRQLVLEGIVIAAGAGIAGIALARLLVHSAALVGSVTPVPDPDLTMDLRVLAVALAASVLTAVLVSVVPAMQVSRLHAGAVLKDGGGAVRRRSAGGQRALVAAQVGASLVLLTAAAIVFGALRRTLAAHETFEPGGLIDVQLDVDASVKDPTRQLAFYRAVLAQVVSEPEIAGAALTSTVPPFQWASRATVFRRGEEPPPGALIGRELESGLRVDAVEVSRDFFDLMRIPLLRGRVLAATDDEHSAPVAVVSRALAEALWPGQDPVGRFIAWPAVEGPPRPPVRVVGVVGDTRDVSLSGGPSLAMYLPFAQRAGGNLGLIARGRGGASVAPATLRRIVAAVDPRVAVLGGRSLLDRLRDETRPQRTASAWIGVFGIIALLLAAIGLYGVVAQDVLQRTRELAVRSALGASPGGILRTVLGDGMRLAALGGAAGALGTIAALGVLRSFFTGVGAVDMRAAIVSAAPLALAMLAATYLPARRAARLNPADALRCD